ncbi:MAG: FAD synthase [Candidatus Methanofastidiosa archaeon]|nr:FAD synthase [Candidatus Methanofastidiosa archaeon]
MKVLVAGTFDILHPGHIYLFNEAKKYGDVHVIVARDENVRRIKGKKTVFDENERKLMVESLKMVEKAYLGDPEDFFKMVQVIAPDIIFLGPDQDDKWIRERIRQLQLDIEIIQLEKRLNYSSSWTKDILKRINDSMEVF